MALATSALLLQLPDKDPMKPQERAALPKAPAARSSVPSLPSEVEEVLRAIVRALAIEAARSHFKDED